MRILLLNSTGRYRLGGGNRVVVDTCQFLTAAGHSAGLAIHDDLPTDTTVELFRLGPASDEAACRTRLLDALDRFRPDVVQVHFSDAVGLLADLAARVPTCLFIHDQSWFCSAGDRSLRGHVPCHRPHGLACLAWHYASGCGGIRPGGNWVRWQRVQRRRLLLGLRPVRIQVASAFMRQGLIENGYEKDRIDLVPLYAQPVDGPDATEPGLIFTPSRLVPAKGIQLLIEAMAGLQSLPWRLVIAGDGPQRPALERLASRHGIAGRVSFLGEVTPEIVSQWYMRAQVVVAPILRHEPFGMVGPEAQAHGKAVIAFGGGGVDEWLVDGRTGIRVQERSATALREAIRTQLENPHLSRELGSRAGRHFDHFRPAAYLDRLLKSFERTRGAATVRAESKG